MLLKAGTYRFKDVMVGFSNLPLVTSDNIQEYLDDLMNYITFDVGVNYYLCPLYFYNGSTYVSYIYMTPNVPITFGVGDEPDVVYRDDDGEVSNTAIYNQEFSIPNDIEVNDVVGTWYISNTNYNEVNAPVEDTIYTEKSSWYKSVADAIRSKKGTTAPILRDDFASEISSITGGGETPYYDGTVIIEKAESVLGLRRFKDGVTPFSDVEFGTFQAFYNENHFDVTPIDMTDIIYGMSPIVNLIVEGEEVIQGIVLDYYEATTGNRSIIPLSLAEIEGDLTVFGDFNVLSTSNSTVDKWLLANTEGVSV